MAVMPKPTPVGEALVLPPLPDPMNAAVDMSRAAREERAALRRAHPEAWRRNWRSWGTSTPNTAPIPSMEYGGDAATDPDYPDNGADLIEFNANGDELSVDRRAPMLQSHGLDTLTAVAARLSVDFERSVRLAPSAIERAGRAFGQGFHPRKSVKPDLLATPQLTEEEEAAFVSADHDAWRMDWGAPAPRLALEALSEGNAGNNPEVKVHLYAAMGVPEYFVHDLGGLRWQESPRELRLFRLGADGAYVRQPAAEACPSRELGVWLRMWNDPQERRDAADGVKLRCQAPPRLQYGDRTGRWHDAVADRELAIRDEGREEGAAAMALQCLDVFLARVAARGNAC